MIDSYTICLNCGAFLDFSGHSTTHARTLNTHTYPISYAWCLNCNRVTWFDPPKMVKVLGKLGCYIGSSMVPKEHLGLEDILNKHFYFEISNIWGNKIIHREANFTELMFSISRCFVERATEKNSYDIELAAWEEASLHLPEGILAIYLICLEKYHLISAKRLLSWLLQLRTRLGFPSYIPNPLNSKIQELEKKYL